MNVTDLRLHCEVGMAADDGADVRILEQQFPDAFAAKIGFGEVPLR